MRGRFREMWKWFRKLMPLFPLPEWGNSGDVQKWTFKALPLADQVADFTETELDDKMVDALEKIANNNEAWDVFYEIIANLINSGADKVGDMVITKEQCAVITDVLGIDWEIFEKLLEWIKKLIDFWNHIM